MNLHSSILHSSNKGNMFNADGDGEARIEIIEQPKARGFRFRYSCEGPSHGGVPGASSDKNVKTYPAVKIANFQGYAKIVVQLVTNEENPRLHPHSLVGRQCQNGICTVQCGPKDMTATFPNLGIQHITKKNVARVLEERYIAAEMQLSSINDGYPQEVQKNIKDEDRKRISTKAQNEAKSIDLSVVRLMFIAYLPDSNGAFSIMLKPVISEAIFDNKAPSAATLKICRMDCNSGCAVGGDEVYILCDKVQKDDIQVRFVEEDMQGNELWEAYGNFSPTDVHRQYAIVFRTPPYSNQAIKQPVHVNVQLRRRSDGEVSEPRPFTFLPRKEEIISTANKRRKMVSEFPYQSPGGSGGYNYSAFGVTSPQGNFQFQGSPGSGGSKAREARPRPPPVKQENPQKCPLDPSMLFKINSVKQEPRSPESQEFGSRHSSFQGSPMSTTMSEPSPPPAPSPPMSEPKYFPGTQIPVPRDAKVHRGLPQIDFKRPVNIAPTLDNAFQSNNQQQQVQQQHLHPNIMQLQQQQQNYVIQQQQQQQIISQSGEHYESNNVTNNAYIIATQQLTRGNVTGTSPTSDVSQSVANNQSWTNMQTVTSGQMITEDLTFDQNHNPLQTIAANDIVDQALNQATTGPGSGSLGLANFSDPLMSAPITQYSEHIVLQQQSSLSDLSFLAEMFDDIESDAVKGVDPSLDQEHDFASVLYDTSITSLTPLPVSNALPTLQADGIESDSAVVSAFSRMSLHAHESVDSLTKEAASLSPYHPVKAQKIPKEVTETKIKSELKIETKPTESETSKKAEQIADARMKELKLAEAEKLAAAIHDYSVTGDVRILLVLQRHLTAFTDDNGDTPIHVAVIHQQTEVLSALLDVVLTLPNLKEILNTINSHLMTALHIATLTDNIDAVVHLLRAGADPLITDKNGNHAIHVACRHGNADILRRILDSRQCRDRQFDVKNHRGLHCFHLAVKAKKNNEQCLQLLKQHDCDVNAVDEKSGRTALHIAVESANLLVVGVLLTDCNADLEVSTYDGYTPLHVAAANDHCDIATLLLMCGANRDANTLPPNHEEAGEKPLDLACSDEMKAVFSKDYEAYAEEKINLLDKYSIDNEDIFSLDPVFRIKLCNLLNEERTGSDWLALADNLQLGVDKRFLKNSANPACALIKAYEINHGTCHGLRNALLSIGRHDVVQLLNQAIDSPTVAEDAGDSNKNILLEDDERTDSAIGSMSVQG